MLLNSIYAPAKFAVAWLRPTDWEEMHLQET